MSRARDGGPSDRRDPAGPAPATPGPRAEPRAEEAAALTVDIAALRRRDETRHAMAGELSVAWLTEALRGTDAEVERPASFQLVLHLQPRGVVVGAGQLDVAFSVPCGRCLAPAAVHERADLAVTFMPGDPVIAASLADDHEDDDADGAEGLTEDDVDAWGYDGSTLSLAPMLAEQVQLAYPMRLLCARGEACRGLCSNCGADLNLQQAGSLVCASCGQPVPLTPVAAEEPEPGASDAVPSMPLGTPPGTPLASPPASSPAAGSGAPAADPAGRSDTPAKEGPMAAALKKLLS